MKKTDAADSDPFVLEASMTDDGDVDLVLTRAGFEVFEQALEVLRETNPKATYQDVLAWMVEAAIEDLEAEMN
jgi:hypothetical protein